MTVTGLFLADSHFDEQGRFDEVVRVHDWIADEVERRRPTFVGHAGDVYERASTPRERLAAASFFTKVASVCPVILVRGNHDKRRDLELLAQLRTRHSIHVVEQAQVIMLRDGMGHLLAHVACMAWPTRQGLTEDGAVRDSIRTVLSHMSLDLHAGEAPRILLGHFDIRGAKVGEGQPMISGAITVGPEDLSFAGADVVVCGHIHKPQDFVFDGKPILYTGSPARHDFGEIERKSVTLLTFHEGDRGVDVERLATPIREMLLLKAHFGPGEILTDWNTTHGTYFFQMDLPPEESIRGADIRIRYEVAREHRDAAKREAEKQRAMLLATGAATVEVEDELVVTTRAREGAVAVAEERTLEGKLEAMWVAQNRVPDPPVRGRLFGRLAELEV